MRHKAFLYILLFFLVIMNCFFLYNYLGDDKEKQIRDIRNPDEFLIKELKFNTSQKEQFHVLKQEHHHRIRRLSDDIKFLKDQLFKNLEKEVDSLQIDRITMQIAEKVRLRDLETFYHFKEVQELCDDEQKKKFNRIIQDALQKGHRHQRPPHHRNTEEPPPPMHMRPEGVGGHRPPPPKHH